MQNKSAIWIFTVLLTLASLYQLSFTFVARNIENEAKEIAQRKVDSVIAVKGELPPHEKEKLLNKFIQERLTEISHEKVYLGFTYKEVKRNEINLGLDLQGGMNVTLEVSLVDLIKALSGYSTDEAFLNALAEAKKMQRSSNEDFVTLFGKAFEKVAPGQKLAAIFHNRENKDKFPRDASNKEILNIIRKEAESAISRTEQVIRKRIDNLGVVQPKVQRLESSGRIIVELPGVKNTERVRKILQGTAKLEFWETYNNQELYNAFAKLNDLLKKKNQLKENASKENTAADSTAVAPEEKSGNNALSSSEEDSSAVSENEEEDILSELGLEPDSAGITSDTTSAQPQSFDDFAKENPLFGVLRPMLAQDQQGNYYPAEGPVVGYAAAKDTAKVRELLTGKEARKTLPPNVKFFWGAKPFDEAGQFYQLYAIKVTSRDGRAPLDGDVIVDARPSTDPLGNPEVTMLMNAEGAKIWRYLTKENVGKYIAIVLDNYVYSAPKVQSEISGGRSSISGRFTVEEAEDLANVLKAGKLPAPAKIIEEAVVGPSLGKEAIKSGLNSFIAALFLILIYMIFYYSKAGAVADVALLANIFFILGVLASIGATLTLPGIAGIVLTIGMSVDANVLIYERIREELDQGKGIKLAIADGYKNAYSSIIDANITTGFTGIILLTFGTGPIKGFATTLIIGILTSLFSAIFITRLIFEYMLDKKQEVSFFTKLTQNAFKNINWQFIKKRKIFYGISGTLIAIGLVSIFTRGFDAGVDFTGGRNYLVRFEQPVLVEEIANSLENVFIDENGIKLRPEVKTYGSSNQVKITTKYLIYDDAEDTEERVEAKLNEGLKSLGINYEILSSQKVGPTIADDIKTAAVWSIIFSLIVIFLYIVFRFRKWQFGLGALVAMFHDVLIVLGIFSLLYGVLPFSLEIDQAFIAAILTVVGYSINDTVVVFDRIREYLGLHKRTPMPEVVNNALNSTLSRTINTSLSTFVVLLTIFLFGGEVIRGFVFALMIGVVVGTYSSLCIASPIILDLDKNKDNIPSKKKKK